ncbi:MAG: DNA gyrase subunit A [Chloroflexota bacterium]|nr:MAG: DNA gyrase subunit A [Chloroflexota bacterium]
MEVGLVRSVDIDHEMQQAYLDYAMSVIVARALPDARDGLKPVHRRILYAMFDMGLRPETSYKKSARIVGEVLGKYHPHGDMAVYETMARLAQDFSMRYLLVDGQGNFGSVDGDPPAAMRYTEARLQPAAMLMLSDIQKETVDFSDNFDGSLTEPDVLPAALPNMLVNGATGIAVGMSTSIPPHNLGEVVDALQFMLAHWDGLDDINIEDLMHYIKGPDFPTGGLIIQSNNEEEGLTSAYGTGRGKVTVQARAHFEEMSRGRNRIIVTELPYMINKASLIERIAELVREERLDGIADLRDESDRQGLRIVIELNKTAEPEKVLQDLFKSTPMRSTFGIIMLALVDGEPRTLSLKQSLRVYLDHRLTVIKRRTEFELNRARQRGHILEGLLVALKNLDEVISLIRKSPDVDTARTRLMKRFKLTEVQAQAILDMPLRRLASLERKKIEEEYKEVQALIKELESLLRSPKKMRQVVGDELARVKETYNDRRRTQIVSLDGSSTQAIPLLSSDLTPDRIIWVAANADGMIARTLDENPPRTSGRDAPAWMARVSTRDTLYLISEQGEAAGVPVHAVPEAENPAEGAPAFKISALEAKDKLAGLLALPPKDLRSEGWFVFTVTRQGMVKKTDVAELPGPTAKTFTLMKVNEGDRFGWVRLTDGKADVLLATADGMAIRFSEDEVRPMGLVAAGVGGIKLGARDEVVGMELIPQKGEIFFVTSDGKGKRVEPGQFPTQGRYGQGVLAWKLSRTSQLVGVAAGKGTLRVTLHLDKLAPKAIRLDEAPLQTRAALGKQVVELKAGDRVVSLTAPWDLPHTNGRESGGNGTPSPGKPPAKKAAPPKAQADGSGEVNGKAPKVKGETKAAKGGAPKEATSDGKARAAAAPRAKTATAKPGAKASAAKKTAAAKAGPEKRPTLKEATTKAATLKGVQPKPKEEAPKATATKGPAVKTKAATPKSPAAKKPASTGSAKLPASKNAAAKPPASKPTPAKTARTTPPPVGAPVKSSSSRAATPTKAQPQERKTGGKSGAGAKPASKTSAGKVKPPVEKDAAQSSPSKPAGSKASTPGKATPAKPSPAKKTPSQEKKATKPADTAAKKSAGSK